MNEKNAIKDLENQARNTKNLVDRINRAHYGMTVDEIIKSIGGGNDDRNTNSSRGNGTTEGFGYEDFTRGNQRWD